MGWPAAVGLVFADGTAAHHACDEAAELARLRQRPPRVSTKALADEVEPTVRENLP
jgi:hypothetical protein